MRLILVGAAADRARIRRALTDPAIEVVGEAATVSAARRLGVDADGLLVAASSPSPEWEPDEPLTPREIQVLELLAEGLPNKAIAARLDISDQTVKFHMSSICGKLGAANRTDAVRRAVRRGLVTL